LTLYAIPEIVTSAIESQAVKVPYIRLGKGLPSDADQRAALAATGLTEEELAEAYVERVKRSAGEQPAWDYLLMAVREDGGEPDEVWIARPAILAASEQEARERLAMLTERGAVLRIASTGGRYRWHPDAAEAIRLAAEVRADERALVMAKARAGLKALGRQHFTPQQWKEAKALWADPDVTAEAAATRSGVGMRTLYRKFGPKGTPAFRGKGKRK
jgi:hypothetical protein